MLKQGPFQANWDSWSPFHPSHSLAALPPYLPAPLEFMSQILRVCCKLGKPVGEREIPSFIFLFLFLFQQMHSPSSLQPAKEPPLASTVFP